MKFSKTGVAFVAFVLMVTGASYVGHGQALSHDKTAITRQAKYQRLHHVKLRKTNLKHIKGNWFRDGLSNRQMKAREWVSWYESRDHWSVLSYGHRCIGRYQLDPDYLGHKDGHVNLNHKHQVQVADKYAKDRYGSWVNAKRFWQTHHWY